VVIAVVIWAQWDIGSRVLAAAHQRDRIRNLSLLGIALFYAWLAVGFALNFSAVTRIVHVPVQLRGMISGGAYLWLMSFTSAYLIYRIWTATTRRVNFDPQRRRLLTGAGSVLAATPLALIGFGAIIQRTDFRVTETDIPVPNLPRDLQGLRILQLSDIHLGPFLSENDLARVIDESLSLRPHLAVITGDLISVVGDPLDACLRQIARLRPEAGILGCLGNHEVLAGTEEYTTREGARLGIDFLSGRARSLRFGGATLNVAGVAYESIMKRKTYLTGAERLVEPGVVNLLLSHNPDVFPVASRKGFDVTLAGHTHGGQVTVEMLNQTLNVARFVTPFVSGYYHLPEPASALYVTRGIGTIGLPVRIGAPPEISLLRLVAA